MERFDAVTEPEVSSCVQAGSRYTPSLRSGIADEAEGYGSTTTMMSIFSMAFLMSSPRVCEFGACPQ